MPKFSKWSHLSGFLTKILYEFLISLIRATGPAHLTLLDFITLIIFGEGYKLRSSSLYIFFRGVGKSNFIFKMKNHGSGAKLR